MEPVRAHSSGSDRTGRSRPLTKPGFPAGVIFPSNLGRPMSAAAPVRSESPVPSMTATTVRRAIAIGWRYLAIGTGISLLLAVILVVGAHSRTAFDQTFPLELPLFSVMGSLGGLLTFASDRTKGVFEYLIAYGVRARSLFLDGLMSTAVMVVIILGLSLSVGVGAATVSGIPLTEDFVKTVAFY